MEQSYRIYIREALRLEEKGQELYEKHLMFVVRLAWKIVRSNNISLSKKPIKKGLSYKKQKIFTKNTTLQMHNPFFILMDLIQEGNIGLLKAIEKYDSSFNVKFTTYAYNWINTYILRYINDNFKLNKSKLQIYTDNYLEYFIEQRHSNIENIETKYDINKKLSILGQKEQQLLKYRYNLNREGYISYQNIALKLGIAIETARRIEKKAIAILRSNNA
jgi:RNA polymerase sigma factor (sigma-70 family)